MIIRRPLAQEIANFLANQAILLSFLFAISCSFVVCNISIKGRGSCQRKESKPTGIWLKSYMKTFKSKLEKPVHSDLNPELLMFLNYFQIIRNISMILFPLIFVINTFDLLIPRISKRRDLLF